MTDRRRNLFVLLLVVGAAGRVARRHRDEDDEAGARPQGRRLARLRGQADALQRGQQRRHRPLDRHHARARRPARRRRAGDPADLGDNQIDVSLPDVKNADEAEQQVGTTAQLFFYDWEKNVLGPDGKPHPDDAAVTGGAQAGQPGAGTLTLLRRGHARRRSVPATNDRNDDTTNGLFYVVDDTSQDGPLRARRRPRRTLREVCRNDNKDPTKRRRGPARHVIVQAGIRRATTTAAEALARERLVRPQGRLRRCAGPTSRTPSRTSTAAPGGAGQPNVTFEFTGRGRATSGRTSRARSPSAARTRPARHRRGQTRTSTSPSCWTTSSSRCRTSTSSAEPGRHRRPQRARRSPAASRSSSAQRLANLLKTGALPIRLDLISQSQVSATLGQQALDEGGHRRRASASSSSPSSCSSSTACSACIAVVALLLYGIYLFALDQADPGHADAAGHRGPGADHRRLRRREHRHLRTRQGGGGRAGRSIAAAIATGLHARPRRRSSTRTSSRCSRRSSSSSWPRPASRASRSCSAWARSSRCSRRCSPPRRCSGSLAHAG